VNSLLERIMELVKKITLSVKSRFRSSLNPEKVHFFIENLWCGFLPGPSQGPV
jgi:hypothetical protein